MTRQQWIDNYLAAMDARQDQAVFIADQLINGSQPGPLDLLEYVALVEAQDTALRKANESDR